MCVPLGLTSVQLGIWRMKPSIFLILFGFFITNAALSPYLFYFTDWMGTAVYGYESQFP